MVVKKMAFIWIILGFLLGDLVGQECIGGSMASSDAYLYGRFEVRMQSAEGSGIVSSFFLYNLDIGCNWPEENNEIDIEMTGNSDDILFTTHHPGPWYLTDTYDSPFNPHEGMHDYVIEWEPDIVRWFVDGNLVNVQDQDVVDDLTFPMHIMINLWVSAIEEWVGPWDPSIMPVESVYDYIRFYEYTPGTGNYGSDNNYTFGWEDELDFLDTDLWEVEEYGGFENNVCTFKSSSLDFSGGYLYLQLEEPDPDIDQVPVTFSVDLNEQTLSSSDVIYLNGTFNDWCGNCAPMTEENGVWSLTIDLDPGRHEFIFTKNTWEESGNPPMGSECDFFPCDQYANYGILLTDNAEPLVLNTYCWQECSGCQSTPVAEVSSDEDKKLIGIFDVLGRPVPYSPGHLLLYYYSDGSVVKRISWERD